MPATSQKEWTALQDLALDKHNMAFRIPSTAARTLDLSEEELPKMAVASTILGADLQQLAFDDAAPLESSPEPVTSPTESAQEDIGHADISQPPEDVPLHETEPIIPMTASNQGHDLNLTPASPYRSAVFKALIRLLSFLECSWEDW